MTNFKMLIDLYGIRHKPTGYWIPPRNGKGGSYDEPKPGTPRLFLGVRAAQSFLAQWLKGIHVRIPGGQNWEGDWDGDDVKIKPVESRKKDEMEIVLFRAEEQ